MWNRLTFAEKRNIRSIIPKLLLDIYKENYPFRAKYSTNAYVFVISIIPNCIGIYLFPSITPISK